MSSSKAKLYLLSEDDRHEYALYAVSEKLGNMSPPHDHTTWAVIAGIEGEELNKFYRRLDNGENEGQAQICESHSEIVGIELQGKLLELAMLRRDHYGYSNVEFFQSPDSCNLHENLGNFDYIVLSAVLEHMLPNERKILIPKLWQLLALGGILFIDQTPFRYFPIEVHTTHLPLINYFPSKLACFCANKHVGDEYINNINVAAYWFSNLLSGCKNCPKYV